MTETEVCYPCTYPEQFMCMHNCSKTVQEDEIKRMEPRSYHFVVSGAEREVIAMFFMASDMACFMEKAREVNLFGAEGADAYDRTGKLVYSMPPNSGR